MAHESAWQTSPVLGVHDVRAAARHFEERLGFEVASIFDGIGEEGAVYAIVGRAGTEIHLQIRRRALRGGEREAIEADVYVRVPDAKVLRTELGERDAVIFRDLQDEPYGMRDFTAEGPEGYRVTFGSPL